jgi:hypothetical protein
MPEKPVTHGIEHRPSSYDPSQTDPWTYVSASGDAGFWDPTITYDPGDTAEDGAFVYLCMVRNTNVGPGGDPNWARYWHISAPVFQNGWVNGGGSLAPLRYKLLTGPPHVLDEGDGSVIDYSDHHVLIQGSCAYGDNTGTIFTLPPAYEPDSDLYVLAVDDEGGSYVIVVFATGDVTPIDATQAIPIHFSSSF